MSVHGARFEFSKKEKFEKNEKNHKISKKSNIFKNFWFFFSKSWKLVKFASKICKQKLQAKFASKIWIQNQANNEASMNQKAKVTFFIFLLFDRNQPMTYPLRGR